MTIHNIPKKVHLRPVSPHIGLISQARHSNMKMKGKKCVWHATFTDQHAIALSLSNHFHRWILLVIVPSNRTSNFKIHRGADGCAQLTTRFTFCCGYLRNVTERMGNVTISRTELLLVRRTSNDINYQKWTKTISKEINHRASCFRPCIQKEKDWWEHCLLPVNKLL